MFDATEPEVSQLCSHPMVGWPDAPLGVFGLQSIQMASIRAGGHSHGSGMVFALLAFVPRRRGAIDRRNACDFPPENWTAISLAFLPEKGQKKASEKNTKKRT